MAALIRMNNRLDKLMKMRAVITNASAIGFQAKLTEPFRTVFGQHDILDNGLLIIELSNGIRGYGEAAVATHITGETVDETLQNLNRAASELIGHDISNYAQISNYFREKLNKNACALAAVEMALLDALMRCKKIPLWKFFGPRSKVLKTAMTVVLGSVAEAEKSARAIFKRGIRAFKIKIGADENLDFERVLCVKKIIKNYPIYLDANAGFTAEKTLKFLKRLRQSKIEPALIEQPVGKHDWEGLAKVTRESKITVVADETVSSLTDAKKLIKMKAANAVNIKLMKFGVLAAIEIARLSKKAGFKLMIGQMMESELASTAAAHLASGFGGFDFVDLDAPFFIKEKVMKKSFLSSNGTYDLRKIRAGVGTEPKFPHPNPLPQVGEGVNILSLKNTNKTFSLSQRERAG